MAVIAQIQGVHVKICSESLADGLPVVRRAEQAVQND
jgi:hypothetical protein